VYAYVKGRLEKKGLDRAIVETQSGVAYEILIAESERSEFPDTGEEIQLHTHLYVREDKQRLYGFINRAARDFFRQLMTQKGIGPSLALSVLSDMGAERFREAIYDQDIDALKEIKGVGKKTAQRLIVEMAEKLPEPDEKEGPRPLVDEAIEALLGLGFRKSEATEAVEQAADDAEHDDVEDLLSDSLTRLEG
jgi:Holliday junction DNA helicase RuvA